ncbi:MAG: oxaloacetate decarboxylase [Rhodospirillaceae bacterium]|nr:oxaloacetate decarboxylase [Rhodospirillaceae bacterium]
MHWSERRERFRILLEGNSCVYPGSVFDPISARIAEELGFEVGMFAGSVGSMAVLGSPDLILLSLSEFADQAYRICRAGNLALLVDADHGYGNALNVRRTVEELETAGVAALTIEDTALPQNYGTVGSSELISIEEGVGKMRAALDGRQDPSLVIAGRTGAMSITGVEDTVARIRAYELAGVDAVFLSGISNAEQLAMVSDAVKIPIFLGGSASALGDIETLGAAGVRICLQGHQPFQAAVKATYDTLKALREGKSPSELMTPAPKEMLNRLTRDDDHKRWMREWLGGEMIERE